MSPGGASRTPDRRTFFQRGEWSLEPDPDETERIVRGHMRVLGNEPAG